MLPIDRLLGFLLVSQLKRRHQHLPPIFLIQLLVSQLLRGVLVVLGQLVVLLVQFQAQLRNQRKWPFNKSDELSNQFDLLLHLVKMLPLVRR